MYILDKKIKEKDRLIAEVLCGRNNLLLEEKHLIPHVREYYDIIWDKVSKITELKDDMSYLPNCMEKTFDIVITEEDFTDVETFFDKLNFRLNLTITNRIPSYSYDGGYSPQPYMKDIINGNIIALKDSGKLPIVKINVVIKTSVITIEEAIAASVYHEFTHAYEDYQRMIKNKGKNSIAAYTIYSNYRYINLIKSIVPPYGKYLGNILYMLSQVESKAYISQAIGEIDIHSIKWASEFSEIVRSTKAYNNYKRLLSLCDGLKSVDDTEIQKQLLSAFNQYSGIVGKFNNGESRKYVFKTYNQMTKWLYKKAIYSYNNFIDVIAKRFEDNQIRNKLLIR